MSLPLGTILLVPVTFTDGSGRKNRPVVAIHDGGDADLLVAPVTSQAARSQRDTVLVHWRNAGLKLPSIVRLEKLATVEKSIVVRSLGRLSEEDLTAVKAALKQFFSEIVSQ